MPKLFEGKDRQYAHNLNEIMKKKNMSDTGRRAVLKTSGLTDEEIADLESYKETNEKIRKNVESGKKPTEGVDEKQFNETKEKLSKAAKEGKKF